MRTTIKTLSKMPHVLLPTLNHSSPTHDTFETPQKLHRDTSKNPSSSIKAQNSYPSTTHSSKSIELTSWSGRRLVGASPAQFWCRDWDSESRFLVPDDSEGDASVVRTRNEQPTTNKKRVTALSYRDHPLSRVQGYFDVHFPRPLGLRLARFRVFKVARRG